jgi:cupin fold WbuC family metalloprotein
LHGPPGPCILVGMSPLQLIDAALFLPLIERARQSPRLRTNHNFHSSMEDNPHRFLNVMIQGTYIAPHRHHDPPKSESFLVLEGELAFFTFDDAGQITSAHILGRDALGIDIQPGVWAHHRGADGPCDLLRGKARPVLGGE